MRLWFLLGIIAAATAAAAAADAPTEEWSAVVCDCDLDLSPCLDTFVQCAFAGDGTVFDFDTVWECYRQFSSSLDLEMKKYKNGGYLSRSGFPYAAPHSSPTKAPLSNTNDVFAAVTTDGVLVDVRRLSSSSSDGINRTEAEVTAPPFDIETYSATNQLLLERARVALEAARNDTEKLASDIEQFRAAAAEQRQQQPKERVYDYEAARVATEKLQSDIAQSQVDQQELQRVLANNQYILSQFGGPMHLSAEAEAIMQHARAQSVAGWWNWIADLLDDIFDTVERQRALDDMPATMLDSIGHSIGHPETVAVIAKALAKSRATWWTRICDLPTVVGDGVCRLLYNLGSWFSDRVGDVLDYVFGRCSLLDGSTSAPDGSSPPVAEYWSWMRLPTGPVHSVITSSSPFVDTTGGIYTAVGAVILMAVVVLADWSWLLVRYAMGSDLVDAENETKADKLMQQQKPSSPRVRIRHITSIVACVVVLAACQWMMSLPTASASASIEHTIQTTVKATTSLPSTETASNSADMQTLMRMRQTNIEADVKKRFDAAKARVGSCSTVQCIAKDMEDMCRVTVGDTQDGTLSISDLSVWSMTYNQWMALRHKLALLKVVWGPVPEIRQRLDRLSILEDAMSLHVSRFASVNGIDPDRAWRMHRPICDTMNATYVALATLVQPGSVVRPKDVAVTDVHFLIAQLDQGYVHMMMGLSRDEHLFWSNHINLVLAAWMPKPKADPAAPPSR